MLAIIVLFLCLPDAVFSQGVFSPAQFTEASCTGSNKWTTWFDSGDPNISTGEFEVTKQLQQIFPSFMCPEPIAIEVRLFIGTDYKNRKSLCIFRRVQ